MPNSADNAHDGRGIFVHNFSIAASPNEKLDILSPRRLRFQAISICHLDDFDLARTSGHAHHHPSHPLRRLRDPAVAGFARPLPQAAHPRARDARRKPAWRDARAPSRRSGRFASPPHLQQRAPFPCEGGVRARRRHALRDPPRAHGPQYRARDRDCGPPRGGQRPLGRPRRHAIGPCDPGWGAVLRGGGARRGGRPARKHRPVRHPPDRGAHRIRLYPTGRASRRRHRRLRRCALCRETRPRNRGGLSRQRRLPLEQRHFRPARPHLPGRDRAA